MSVRFGIIGCGSIARHRHLPELADNPDAEIVAVCDIVPSRAEEMGKKYDARPYKKYEDLLALDEIDAVVVCTPNYLHAPITIAALKAGKHVLCEKPMATSRAEAEEMIATAEENGRFLMIGHNQRLMAPHVKAKELLDSGKLGRVLTFRTCFGHGGPEGWCIDKSKDTWFFKKQKAFVGAMGDLGVHKADLIRWLLGEEVEEVAAFVTTLDKSYSDDTLIDVDDNATCVLRMEGGAIGNLIASWTYYGGEDNDTVLYCEKGVMRLTNDPDFQVKVDYANGEREYWRVGEIATNEKQVSSGIPDMFVESIVQGKKPEISGEEGMKALDIILACLQSAETGAVVKVAK